MSADLLKIIYLVGLLVAEGLRLPQRLAHIPQVRQKTMADNRFKGLEQALLSLLILGVWIAPIVYCLTPWLDGVNYQLPFWAAWIGSVVFVIGLWLRWKAQHDLGQNYSSTLTVWQGHRLVTTGIYHFIRHPIYAALWLWGLTQPLLLQNWIAGLAGLIAIVPLYLLRVPREEAMLLQHFGDEYRAYMAQTGRIVPRLKRSL